MNEKGIELKNLNIKYSVYDMGRGIVLPEMSNELAYLCGILAGDGYISKNYNGKSRNRIICGGNPSNEKEFYDKLITSLFKKVFNIDINSKLLGNRTYGFQFGSQAIVYFLTKIIGLPRGKKYATLKIPPLFFQDKGLLLSFVKGVFDTDFGFCLCKKYKEIPYYPQMAFASRSKKFTMEIWRALKELGLRFDGKVYRVFDKDDRAKKGFTITYRFDLYGHKYLIKILKIIKLRHTKHIKKLEEWERANRTNKKVLRLAGEGFEPLVSITNEAIDPTFGL